MDIRVLIVIDLINYLVISYFFHSSAMETKLHSDILTGRPFGGRPGLLLFLSRVHWLIEFRVS